MRSILPTHLIHSILLLSVSSSAITASSDETSTLTSASSTSTHTHAATVPSTSSRPVTLWDIGFSLNDKWADLRAEEECPVPPDFVVVNDDATVVVPNPKTLDTPSESQTTSTEPPLSIETSRTEAGDKPVDKDDFVSFEDWKKLKLAEEEIEDRPLVQDDTKDGRKGSVNGQSDSERFQDGDVDPAVTSAEPPSANLSERQRENISVRGVPLHIPQDKSESDTPISTTSESSSSVKLPTQSPVPPPVHNRYNYASPDCSARIHSSSPQTQHASSLLHKSKDRYMLTPCKAGEHWVVVELCDEIRVEAVEVAVWEFFSGVVREVRVNVGGAEDEDEEEENSDGSQDDGQNNTKSGNGWKEVGAFIGKNVRGVQTFTLPQPTSFHRFLRLDFPSYYGTEYYCPVSQLKVYGMNQMEAFKWEQKRLAASAKGREKEKDRESEERRARETREREERAREERAEREKERILREKELGELEKLVLQHASRTAGGIAEMMTEAGVFVRSAMETSSVVIPATPSSSSEPLSVVVPTSSGSAFASGASSPAVSGHASSTKDSSDMPSRQQVSSNNGYSSSPSNLPSSVSHVNPSSSSSMTLSTNSPSPSSSTYSRSPPPRSDSSESIYAFIIRRLTALEGNSTLVARYIEEQTKVMRGMLGRVERNWEEWKGDWEGEDRGRWESERMRQEDRLGRVISQMEQQRSAMDHERRAMLSQMRILSDELGYERRRGLAQLFILLVIIVLGVVTRGNTIEAVLKPLLAEARRRRNRKLSGPLAGLKIDMGQDRPVAVIGRRRSSADLTGHLAKSSQNGHFPGDIPQPKSGFSAGDRVDQTERERENASSPTPRIRTISRGNSNNIRRPSTPTSIHTPHVHPIRRRIPSTTAQPTFRSFSLAAVPSTVFPAFPVDTSLNQPAGPGTAMTSPTTTVIGGFGIGSPRPRGSLPPLPTRNASGMNIPPRRLARSAHLHTLEGDRLREKSKRANPSLNGSKPLLNSPTSLTKIDTSPDHLLSPTSNGDRTPRVGDRSTPKSPLPKNVIGVSSPSPKVSLGSQVSPMGSTSVGEVFDDLPMIPGIGDDELDNGEWAETEAETETEDEGLTEGSVSEIEDEVHVHGVICASSVEESNGEISELSGSVRAEQEVVRELKEIWDTSGPVQADEENSEKA